MDESEEGLDEWRDFGVFSEYAPGNFGNKSIDHIYNLTKEVENSMNFENNGSNSLVIIDDSSKTKSGVTIAERRAIKCGFNASKISTPNFSNNNSNKLHLPYVTISSDISPHTLLESPMLLPNSQLSPTTGTFASRPLDGDGQMLISASSVYAADKGSDGSSSMLKPDIETNSLPSFHDNQVLSAGDLAQNLVAAIDRQSVTSVQSSLGVAFPVHFSEEVGRDNHDAGLLSVKNNSDYLTVNLNSSTLQPCDTNIVPCLQMPHENRPSMEDAPETHDSLDGNQNGIYPHAGTARTTEDGYNWRKYGQKQVKGSEYPRSYYKCTHPNCQVKKKVERSHDGQITEIIYKSAHNHPKPQLCRKSTSGSIPFNETSDVGDGSGSCMKADSNPVCRSVKSGYKDAIGSDWRIDGFSRTSPPSTLTDVSDPLSATQGKPMGELESERTPEFSSTIASYEEDDEEEDAATQGSFFIGHDGENEPEYKIRKKESYFAETTLGSRAVREPRVVLQAETEVDILDDGYRWRKYGQKVVKGNPNPRSYYKCTTPGCTVRKHVERSSQSLKHVIMTYEGKHTHEVPAARNSGHAYSGNGNLSAAATSTQTAVALHRNPNLPKPEPHAQVHPLHFDTKIDCSNDFLRPNFLGNLGAGTPYYPMKFPALPNTVSYSPFGLTAQHPAYASTIVPSMPDIAFPLPPGFPHSISSYCNPEGSHSSVQSIYAGQQHMESDVKLLRPKQEQRDDSFFDTDMHSIDHANTSSSVYNHVMGNFRS